MVIEIFETPQDTNETIRLKEHEARKEELKRIYGSDFDKLYKDALEWWRSPEGREAIRNAKYVNEE